MVALTSWIAWLWVLASGASFAASPEGASAPPDPARWLFVGNSLIQRHEVQELVGELARSVLDRSVVTERTTLGGATLQSHLRRTDSEAPLELLTRERWDVVILQPNGRLAMIDRPGGFPYALPPARELAEVVRRRGGRPLLMMTWAYRGQENRMPVVRRNFDRLGAQLDVPVALVGEAFAVARVESPEIVLLDADGVHATLAGAYLEAAVLFGTITGRSPVGGAYPPDLPREVARRLQSLAWRVVQGRTPSG